jgi:diphthamide synthase (EF-2-diphthine--ammonia ligase)
MKEKCKDAVQSGIECIAFGDLFLTDIRAYHEKQLENSGLQPIFPVWGMPTPELARSMIKSGVRGKLTCVDPKLLEPVTKPSQTFVGGHFSGLTSFRRNRLLAAMA